MRAYLNLHTCLRSCRCRKSLELHDKRHRELAVLTQQIRSLEEETGIESPLTEKKRRTLKNSVSRLFESDDETYCVNSVGAEMEVEWADSSTMCSLEDELDIKRMPVFDTKENKAMKKTYKAERKIAHNQTRLKIISPEDIRNINDALHPQGTPGYDQASRSQNRDPLVDNSTVAAGIAFNTRTFRYSALRTAVHDKKLAKALRTRTPQTPHSPDHGIILSGILLKLGVVLDVAHAPKNRKVLIARLGDLIQADLLAVENEARDTMMREAGYWRYVNKTTYNAMVKQNKLWDWNTGQKLEEIEEDEEEEVEEEEEAEENEQLTPFKEAEPNLVQPKDGMEAGPESYDDDYIFANEDLEQSSREPVEDQDILSFKGFKITRQFRTKCGSHTPTVTRKPKHNTVNKRTRKLTDSTPVVNDFTSNAAYNNKTGPSVTDQPDLQLSTLQIPPTSLTSYSSVVKSNSVSQPTTPIAKEPKIFTLTIPSPIEDDAPEAEGWTKVVRAKKSVPARQLRVRNNRRGK